MAITKKHSALSGSSLHNPKGISVTPDNTTTALLDLNVDTGNITLKNTNIIRPETDADGNIDIGGLENQFRNVYISGDVIKEGDVYGGGGAGSGIFLATGSTDTFFATTNDVQITGSLSVEGTINADINVADLKVTGDVEAGGTVTASAFLWMPPGGGTGVYITSHSIAPVHTASLFMTGSGIYREFGTVTLGSNQENHGSTLHIESGSLSVKKGNIIIADEFGIVNDKYNEPIISVRSGSYRSVGIGLRGTAPNLGVKNVIVGDSAAEIITGEGTQNVVIGFEAGYKLGNADKNVIIGNQAGYKLEAGQRNVIIGNGAANWVNDAELDNKLVIHNTNASESVMLYGDFSNNILGVNVKSGSIEKNTMGGFDISDRSYKLIVSGNAFIAGGTADENAGHLVTYGDVTASRNLKATKAYLTTNLSIGKETTTKALEVVGDISASGTIFAKTFESGDNGATEIDISDTIDVAGNITASGDIILPTGGITSSGNITSQGTLIGNSISSSGTTPSYLSNVAIGTTASVATNMELTVDGQISSSGNIFVTDPYEELPNDLGYVAENDNFGKSTKVLLSSQTASFISTFGNNTFRGQQQIYRPFNSAYDPDLVDGHHDVIISGSIDILGDFKKSGSLFFVQDERGTVFGLHDNLENIPSGSENTLVGYQSGDDLYDGGNTGERNTIVGNLAGAQANDADDNVVIGHLAGYNFGNSVGNVVIGAGAQGYSGSDHYSRTDIQNSVILGREAGYFSNNISHSIMIGYKSEVSSSRAGLINLSGEYKELKQTDTLSIIGKVSTPINSAENTLSGINTTNTDEHLRFGVNTLTPSKQLEVEGNISASGDIFLQDGARVFASASRIQIGNNATGSSNSIAIGDSAQANDTSGQPNAGISIGYQALSWNDSVNESAIAIGQSSRATGSFSIALGSHASSSYDSIAIGGNTLAENTEGYGGNIAIGHAVTASKGLGQLSIGSYSKIVGTGTEHNTLIGYAGKISGSDSATLIPEYNVAIGDFVEVRGQRNTVLGSYASSSKVNDGVSIGYQSRIGSSADATVTNKLIAIGNFATASGIGSVGIGFSTNVAGHNAIAIGFGAKSSHNYNVAIGTEAKVQQNHSGIINLKGSEQILNQENSFVLIGKDSDQVKVGIDTLTPQTNLHIVGTGSLVVPVGNETNRGYPVQGGIRYNTVWRTYEGYDGSVWRGLGGVIDVDRNTKILAESPLPNDDNNQLHFITSDQMVMSISGSEENGIDDHRTVMISRASASSHHTSTLDTTPPRVVGQSGRGGTELLHISGGLLRLENTRNTYTRLGHSGSNLANQIEFYDDGGSYVAGTPSTDTKIALTASIGMTKAGGNLQGLVLGVPQESANNHERGSVNVMIGEGYTGNNTDHRFSVWANSVDDNPSFIFTEGTNNTDADNTLPVFSVSSSGEAFVERSLTIGTGSDFINPTHSYGLAVSGASYFLDNMNVDGFVTAYGYSSNYESASVLYDSGSSKIGNSPDDIHAFTGSFQLVNSASTNNDVPAAQATFKNYFAGPAFDTTKVAFGVGTLTPGGSIGGYDLFTNNKWGLLEVSGTNSSLIASGKTPSLILSDDATNVDEVANGNQTFQIEVSTGSANFQWRKNDWSIQNTNTAGQPVLTISSSGKLAINNDKDFIHYALDIVGNISASGDAYFKGGDIYGATDNAKLELSSNTSVGSRLHFKDNSVMINDDDIKFYTDDNIRMLVKGTTGKVGIGTVSPDSQLHIVSGGSSTNVAQNWGSTDKRGMILENNNVTSPGTWTNLDFRVGNADGRIAFSRDDDNAGSFHFVTDNLNNPGTRMYLSSSGEVAIGEKFTTPSHLLHISSSEGNHIKISRDNHDEWTIAPANSDRFQIRNQTDAVSPFVIKDDTGNVGIGKSNGSQDEVTKKLEVGGDISGSGELFVGGTSFFTGSLSASADFIFDDYNSGTLRWVDGSDGITNNYLNYRKWATSATGGKEINNSTGIIKIESKAQSNGLVVSHSMVGVGTATPQSPLTVEGDISASGDLILGQYGSNQGAKLRFTGSATQYIWFGDEEADNAGKFEYRHLTDQFQFVSNQNIRLVISQSGGTTMGHTAVGIGTPTPTKTLTVNGEISSSGDIHTPGNLNLGHLENTASQILFYQGEANPQTPRIYGSNQGIKINHSSTAGQDHHNLWVSASGTGIDDTRVAIGGTQTDAMLTVGGMISGSTAGGLVLGNPNDSVRSYISMSRGNLKLSGDIVAEGNVTAQKLIVSSSVTHMTTSFSSGSTMFGDSPDDRHDFTGSVHISGALHLTSFNAFGNGIQDHYQVFYGNDTTTGNDLGGMTFQSRHSAVTKPSFIINNSKVKTLGSELVSDDVFRVVDSLNDDNPATMDNANTDDRFRVNSYSSASWFNLGSDYDDYEPNSRFEWFSDQGEVQGFVSSSGDLVLHTGSLYIGKSKPSTQTQASKAIYTVGNVGIKGNLNVSGSINTNQQVITANATNFVVDTFVGAQTVSKVYEISAYDISTSGVDSGRHIRVSTVVVANNMGIGAGHSLKAYITEYGIIDNGDEPLLVYDVDVDGNNISLRCSSPAGATGIQIVWSEKEKQSNSGNTWMDA